MSSQVYSARSAVVTFPSASWALRMRAPQAPAYFVDSSSSRNVERQSAASESPNVMFGHSSQ